jgi:4-hydroxythreonine-4-phosphate dehydrogenase
VTAGDPAGIGPEIVARAIASGALPAQGSIVVVAEPSLFDRASESSGLSALPRWDRSSPVPDGVSLLAVTPAPIPRDFALGTPSAFTGLVAAHSVEAAAHAALAGHVDAIVTAPLAKSALAAAGIRHPGHTEFLAELAGGVPVAMMFVAGTLRLTLATVHVPLADVPRSLTADGILQTVRLTREGLARYLGLADPRIAILGLNPHAGEGGMFGREEIERVEPAIARARERGWSVGGPFPADSFFFRRAHEFDAIVALYHDQGLIPVKLLSKGLAVNVTLGLPFLRTSVDHGTAFELAGKGSASPDSLVEAARLAAEWTTRAGAASRPPDAA